MGHHGRAEVHTKRRIYEHTVFTMIGLLLHSYLSGKYTTLTAVEPIEWICITESLGHHGRAQVHTKRRINEHTVFTMIGLLLHSYLSGKYTTLTAVEPIEWICITESLGH